MKKRALKKFSFAVISLSIGIFILGTQSCKTDQPPADPFSALPLAAYDSGPYWSPDGSKILFTSDRDGDHELYVMNIDGSEQTRLTNDPGAEKNPAWSPDSTRIAFSSEKDGNQEIYIIAVNGSNKMRLTENASDDSLPSWSPDSSAIVFNSDRDGNFNVYSMNADGNNQTRLTEHPGIDLVPSWSPDSKKIAFFSNRDGSFEIYIMNADGTDQTRLTDNPARDSFPKWSPDGKKIAFASDRDGNMQLYTMNVDGSNKMRLTFSNGHEVNPIWSSDSSKIAFDTNRDGNYNIYTMNTDGSHQIRLTNHPGDDWSPSWSPDGKKIAFTSDRDFYSEIYVMDANGTNITNLSNNGPEIGPLVVGPLPRSEMDLRQIPFKIVFQAEREQDGKKNKELFLIDPDGSNQINLTNTPEIDEEVPHASPDGHMICFMAVEGKEKNSRIRNVYYMNIDGTGRTKVAENAFNPCWSPDGKYIAYLPGEFSRFDDSLWANKGLEIYNLETKQIKRHPNKNLQHIQDLCWSSNGEWFIAGTREGERIAFKVNDNTKSNLYIRGCRPDLSPDGKKIAWGRTSTDINIGVIDFEAPGRKVRNQKIVIACDPESTFASVDWSPDGNYLAFHHAFIKDRTGREWPWNISICDLRTGKWTRITTDNRTNREPDWVFVQAQKP
jgi:Tol biopolymer transport system component